MTEADPAMKALAEAVADDMAKRGITRFAFVAQAADGQWTCHHTSDELTKGAAKYYLGHLDKM